MMCVFDLRGMKTDVLVLWLWLFYYFGFDNVTTTFVFSDLADFVVSPFPP